MIGIVSALAMESFHVQPELEFEASQPAVPDVQVAARIPKSFQFNDLEPNNRQQSIDDIAVIFITHELFMREINRVT